MTLLNTIFISIFPMKKACIVGWRPRSLNFKDPRGIPVLAPKFGAGTGRGQQFGRGDFQGLSPTFPEVRGRGGDRICSPRRGRGGAGTELQKICGDEDGLAIPESPRKCHEIFFHVFGPNDGTRLYFLVHFI